MGELMQSAEERLQTLIECRDSGVLKVVVDGIETTYRSIADLERAISAVRGEIAPVRGRTRQAIYDRGSA